MADTVELVIKIPKEDFERCKKRFQMRIGIMGDAIANGTPLDDVLDKIKTEIEQNAYPIVHGVNNHELGMTLYGILQVIDKYKAESGEGKE